jgi:hypothetical protein
MQLSTAMKDSSQQSADTTAASQSSDDLFATMSNNCSACKRNIDEAETNYAVSALDGIFHAECFRCTVNIFKWVLKKLERKSLKSQPRAHAHLKTGL